MKKIFTALCLMALSTSASADVYKLLATTSVTSMFMTKGDAVNTKMIDEVYSDDGNVTEIYVVSLKNKSSANMSSYKVNITGGRALDGNVTVQIKPVVK